MPAITYLVNDAAEETHGNGQGRMTYLVITFTDLTVFHISQRVHLDKDIVWTREIYQRSCSWLTIPEASSDVDPMSRVLETM
jgi:hypothetical protein